VIVIPGTMPVVPVNVSNLVKIYIGWIMILWCLKIFKSSNYIMMFQDFVNQGKLQIAYAKRTVPAVTLS
jgi:hypothetical protein